MLHRHALLDILITYHVNVFFLIKDDSKIDIRIQ